MISLEEILRSTAMKHHLRRVELLSRSRTAAVATARSEFFYRALSETLVSSVKVGRKVKRDHTTVLYGAARHAAKHGLPIPRGAVSSRYGTVLRRALHRDELWC